MIYRKIGESGIEASVIALGTWVMGGWMWGGADEKESINAIDAAIDSGINLIDTAPVYGFGVSEEIVGKAIKGKRDKVILATKCGLRWDIEQGDFYFHSSTKGISKAEADLKVYKFLGAESIAKEIELSLKRLQVDYIDLYQTHWQESTTPIEDSMAMLLKLKDQGKIRAIGVSNATPEHMKKYGGIDSDQEKYSMFARAIEERGNVQYCIENNIAVLAYSPLAQGLLTGKISADRKFNEGDVRLTNPLFNQENLVKVSAFCNDIMFIAEEHSATLGQIALAWTFSRRGITHLLCGARTPAQAVENAGAGKIILGDDQISIIDSRFVKYFG